MDNEATIKLWGYSDDAAHGEVMGESVIAEATGPRSDPTLKVEALLPSGETVVADLEFDGETWVVSIALPEGSTARLMDDEDGNDIDNTYVV